MATLFHLFLSNLKTMLLNQSNIERNQILHNNTNRVLYYVILWYSAYTANISVPSLYQSHTVDNIHLHSY